MSNLHYVCSVSGGAGSTVAAHRCVERHGSENVTLVFADTNSEDESLYRSVEYMRDVALSGTEFVWIKNNGRDIWDVFNEFGWMKKGGNNCKASLELKRKPLDEFMSSRWAQWTAVKVSGLDFSEKDDRIPRFDAAVAKVGFSTWHPLLDAPILGSCAQVNLVESWGYPKQVLYEKGYPHNNCGGACVLAGISQFVGLLSDFPERYSYHEKKEKEFFEKTGYPILRNRRGGKTQPMTLSELRLRVESGDTEGLREFRSTCSCMTPEEGDE